MFSGEGDSELEDFDAQAASIVFAEVLVLARRYLKKKLETNEP